MASINQRVHKLELKLSALDKRVKKLENRTKKLETHVKRLKIAVTKHNLRLNELATWRAAVDAWGINQSNWALEVTDMLRSIDWAALEAAYPGGGGGSNPPQEPPDWPEP